MHPWLRSPSPPATGRKRRFGNLLTPPGSPTIVLTEFRMNSSSYRSGRTVALRGCQWVCLVMTTLLLCNPFCATPRSGHSLEVCHPASHRATMGASELQHFSPTDGWDYHRAVNCAEERIVLRLPGLTAQFLLVLPSVPLVSQPIFGPGLWFRPPPAS